MEQNNETLKSENENYEMDIEGTVIKVELKPQLILIQRPNETNENENQDKICEICKKSFSTKQNVETHVKAVHENIKDFESLGAQRPIDPPQKLSVSKRWIFWCKTTWGTMFTKVILLSMVESIY